MASRRLTASILCALALAACGGRERPDVAPGKARLLVSAAASLTDAFEAVETAFEAERPDVDVVLNLAGSSALRAQILEGAPVDVFASANTANMDEVVGAGRVSGPPRIFARNRLEIAVPRGNPAHVSGLESFADEGLRIGLCAEAVPCGDFARRVLARAGVTPALDTNEPDVRALLTKIELGELDAGITYATDVAAAQGAVEGVELPEAFNVVTAYPIATLKDAPHAEAAEAFVRFVLSDAGRTILLRFGFVGP